MRGKFINLPWGTSGGAISLNASLNFPYILASS